MTPFWNVSIQGDSLLDLAVRNFSKLLATLDLNDSLLDGNDTSTWRNSSTVLNPTTIPDPLEAYTDDNVIIAKISLLLVVTALVLIVSYKFVVRLFLGYADRKDDAVPDGFSDDEDSAVVKRSLDLDT